MSYGPLGERCMLSTSTRALTLLRTVLRSLAFTGEYSQSAAREHNIMYREWPNPAECGSGGVSKGDLLAVAALGIKS